MRYAASLRVLNDRAQRKFDRLSRRVNLLRRGLDDSGRTLDLHQAETELSALVVNLQSFWSNWCRAYYLSGALGTRSISGAAINSGLHVQTEQDALTIAIMGSLTPKRPPPAVWPSWREPKWFDPDALTKIITDAQLTNAPAIVSYLNSGRTPLDHLRATRNYYAHRCEHLRKPVLALGPTYLVGRPTKASEILLFIEPNHTVPVIERWILEIRRLAGAMCA